MVHTRHLHRGLLSGRTGVVCEKLVTRVTTKIERSSFRVKNLRPEPPSKIPSVAPDKTNLRETIASQPVLATAGAWRCHLFDQNVSLRILKLAGMLTCHAKRAVSSSKSMNAIALPRTATRMPCPCVNACGQRGSKRVCVHACVYLQPAPAQKITDYH